MQAVGFDFDHGRLDVSLHPFCGGVPDDLRITTRYNESDFTNAIMGVLHETGHAMYERGLPAAWRRQPVGEARGMALHESQSLLIEMQACRSRGFMGFMAPIAQETLGGQGAAWDPDNLYRLATQVAPDFIRVDADEVTYPAHVILRYRLETALIAGDMSLDDLPGAWNEGMRELLGITPPEDRLGCLQDIHWFDGAFGYFPTYTLGALAAAQLFEAATTAHPEIPDQLARGDFTTLLGWLRENVHGLGSSLDTDTILERATGAKLDETVFQRHIQRRYLDG
jgi:carboxypeptidase Taq